MKRLFYVLLSTMISFSCLCACGTSVARTTDSADPRLQIVTTIFPEYDWICSILGDNPSGAEVTLLLDKGIDLHSYQPTVEDIRKISECDVFVYVGGESDEWAEDALKEASNPDMTVVNLLDVLGNHVKEEELAEGMEEEHDHEEEEDHDHEEPEYDEHVWLSLRNAGIAVEHLSEILSEKDPGNADYYTSRTAAYLAELDALDRDYQKAVETAAHDTLVFGDRFPFRYLCDDYDLNYYAAFAGCSAETEASFNTILFLAGKLDEYGLSSILTIEGSDGKIAQTVIDNTASKDQKILELNSMQGTTAQDVRNGARYIDIMKQNLEVLQIALN